MTRYVYRRLRHLVIYRVLHVDDTPHRIALGAAIGLFIGLTPLMGLHMILALLAALTLRANRAVALTVVWISNPATFLPILSFNWLVGRAVIPSFAEHAPDHFEQQVGQLLAGPDGLVARLASVEFWTGFFKLFVALGAELWVGSLIVGLVASLAGYLVTHRALFWYRRRRRWRKARRGSFHANAGAGRIADSTGPVPAAKEPAECAQEALGAAATDAATVP